MQWFTVAFNFLCVLLGLLYEGSHLSLSVRRKITVNVFYSTFTNVFFYFCHVFLRFLTFIVLGERFSSVVNCSFSNYYWISLTVTIKGNYTACLAVHDF